MSEWFPPRRTLDDMLRDLPNPDKTLIGLAKTAYRLAREAAEPTVWNPISDEEKAWRKRFIDRCIAEGEKPTFWEMMAYWKTVDNASFTPYRNMLD